MRRTRTIFLLFGLAAIAGAVGVYFINSENPFFNRADEDSSQAKNSQPTGRTLTNSIGMALVLLPAGNFVMGAPDSDSLAEAHERRPHAVRIGRPFYLAKYEVSVGQFRTFVVDTGYRTAAETDGDGASGYNAEKRGFEYGSTGYNWRNPGYRQGDDHPVVNITWHDAQAFVNWLTKKESRRYRLPTEAEWEYACRAGSTARFGLSDSFAALQMAGNVADQSLAGQWDTETVKKYGLDPRVVKFQAWNDMHAFTAPGGQFKPNAFGLYDMLGNVGEFCSDAYEADFYQHSPELDPLCPSRPNAAHVVRGGTFLNGPDLVRVSSRVACGERYRNYVIGFRVLLEADTSEPVRR
jgi:formylglycine-generating enzyme required for sulfatase activity